MLASGEGRSGTEVGVEARSDEARPLDAARRGAARRVVRTLLRTGLPVLGAALLCLAAIVAVQAARAAPVRADAAPGATPLAPAQSDPRFGIGQGAQAAGAVGPAGAQGASEGLLSSLGLGGEPPPAPSDAPPPPPSLAPVVDSVAALTSPAPSGGPAGLDGGGTAAPAPSRGVLLEDVSSLLARPASPPPPLAGEVPAAAPSTYVGSEAYSGPDDAAAPVPAPVAEAAGRAPAHAPLAPAPGTPQAPAGGSVGVNPIIAMGMAVAVVPLATVLVTLASRQPRITTPVWESVRIVALIERPG